MKTTFCGWLVTVVAAVALAATIFVGGAALAGSMVGGPVALVLVGGLLAGEMRTK